LQPNSADAGPAFDEFIIHEEISTGVNHAAEISGILIQLLDPVTTPRSPAVPQ
jgi:hypothetical protein